jgi:hypothetical protein
LTPSDPFGKPVGERPVFAHSGRPLATLSGHFGSRRWAFHLGLERRVIAGGLSFVHVMISPDLALVNAAHLLYVHV